MAKDYEDKKRRESLRQRKLAAAGRDFGATHDVFEVERRESCRNDFAKFCVTYNPELFYLEWSKNHIEAIEKIVEVILGSSLYAFAMPRGSGKTTLSRMAVMWAISYGHCKYVYLIVANASKAQDGLDAIKTWARFLPEYALDFPEITQGIQALGGVANRASGQLSDGTPTLIEWTKDKIVLPTVQKPRNIWTEEDVERNKAGERILADTSGIVVGVSGLTGDGIRGSLHVIHTGAAIRPDLVIVDDPQSDESAKSPKQIQDRIDLLSGAVLNMAGPDKRIRGIMPCTIIEQGDMAAQILDRKEHPMWRGTITRLLESFPSNMAKWDEYFGVLEAALDENDISGEKPNKFYEENREELEAGCVHNWPQRKDPIHVDAIQTAMELWYRDKKTFMAEFQNDPTSSEMDIGLLTPTQIAHKQYDYDRHTCPDTFDKLVAHVDVQKYCLFYTICAFNSDNFDGMITDFGVWPEQDRRYFSYPDVKPSLADMGCESAEEQVYNGLTQLGMYLKGYVVNKFDGTEMALDKVLVDSGYLTSTVNKFCDQDIRLFVPMQGVSVRATQQPLGTRSGSKATKVGWNMELRKSPQYGRLRYVLADVNMYKTFVHDRFKTDFGGEGCLGLFKDKPRNYQMWADHMRSEKATIVEASNGRRITEWTSEPHVQNHYFDTIVGCHVAGVMVGCKHPSTGIEGSKRKRVLRTGNIKPK